MRGQLEADLSERVKEHKPVVFTEAGAGSKYRVANVGSSPAVDIWYLGALDPEATLIGALAASQSVPMPEALQRHLSRPDEHRHLLIAQSRHAERRWVVTLNVVPADGGAVFHAFGQSEKERDCPLQDFLQAERERLLQQLRDQFPEPVSDRDADCR